MKIFLDPGHGGNNPGAVAASGLTEESVNLDIVMRLGRILTSWGYDIEYSRTENVTVSLAQRANRANTWGADYFISVHCNSNENPSIKGTETFYYRRGTTAERFARTVNTALVNQIGTIDLGIYSANFAVLRLTRMPAILVEVAFISNPQEAALLATSSFRQNCAMGIANGVAEFTQ